MDFKLKLYHKNIKNEELIADLKRVAEIYKTNYISKKQYSIQGNYSPETVAKHLDGWENALLAAGLTVKVHKEKPRYKECSKEKAITDLKNVAEKLNLDSIKAQNMR